MKKIVISSILIFLTASAVFGDFNENDLLFSNDSNLSLFPEINYEKNPAVLQSIKDPFVFSNLDFNGSYGYEKAERIDSAVGEAGGTEIVNSFSLLPSLTFSHFFPGEDGKVTGYSIFYYSNHDISETKSLNYNNASENDSLYVNDQVYNGGIDFYLAFSAGEKKSTDMGLSLGYALAYDPVVFSWVTDNAVNPTLSYVQSAFSDDDTLEFIHKVNFDYGVTLPSRDYDLSFGINCSGSYADRNNKFIPYDSNGDGNKDSVATYETYYFLSPEAGGPDDDVSTFEVKDYDLAGSVNLVGSLVNPVSKEFSIILDGDYHLIDYRYSHYLMHIIEADDADATDSSYSNKYYNSSFGSFSATVGAEFTDTAKKKSLRMGITYSRQAEQYSQAGDTAAGLSQYSSLNPGNYTELNLGVEPSNNILSSNDDLYPDASIVQSIGLAGRCEFKPEGKTLLFLDFGISGSYESLSYKAYNLDTRTVWEEKNISADLSWVFQSAAGVSFAIGDNLTCMIDLKNLGVVGNASLFDETHVADIGQLYTSTDGSVDYSDELSLNASLDLGFILNL